MRRNPEADWRTKASIPMDSAAAQRTSEPQWGRGSARASACEPGRAARHPPSLHILAQSPATGLQVACPDRAVTIRQQRTHGQPRTSRWLLSQRRIRPGRSIHGNLWLSSSLRLGLQAGDANGSIKSNSQPSLPQAARAPGFECPNPTHIHRLHGGGQVITRGCPGSDCMAIRSALVGAMLMTNMAGSAGSPLRHWGSCAIPS
jgi:hypothetical protein